MKMLSKREEKIEDENVDVQTVKKVTFLEFNTFRSEKRARNQSGGGSKVDPTMNLRSIMEDILQSSSESSQLDLVDCY